MPWLSVTIEVGAGEVEAFADALLEHGAVSVSVEDAKAGTHAEQPLFGEPGATPERAWGLNLVRAMVPGDADPTSLVASAAADAGLPSDPAYTVETVPEQDWVRLTQAQFEPIRISQRLWIVPSWHEPPDRSAINLVLDPGVAFGTGSHATTRMCLRWLERTVRGGETVLDYGCGSGILAIAAMKLGAREAVGVDIDPDALVATRRNAERNAVEVRTHGSASRLDLQADLVVANILSNPLKVLAPVLAAHTVPGGRIVLAGLLDSQADEVAAAYEPWFEMSRFASEDGWSALEGVRR